MGKKVRTYPSSRATLINNSISLERDRLAFSAMRSSFLRRSVVVLKDKVSVRVILSFFIFQSFWLGRKAG